MCFIRSWILSFFLISVSRYVLQLLYSLEEHTNRWICYLSLLVTRLDGSGVR
ncbi:hypothetical protein HanIR_Chr01g0011401 [Helianthus annuus]|nr:hypothetical protein HanIR_Chr01g0011401 [Helianthus annuus]